MFKREILLSTKIYKIEFNLFSLSEIFLSSLNVCSRWKKKPDGKWLASLLCVRTRIQRVWNSWILARNSPSSTFAHPRHSDETLMRFVSIVTSHHFFCVCSFLYFWLLSLSLSSFFSSLFQCLHLVIRWLLGKHGLRWWILWARLDGSAPDGKWVFPATSLRSRLWWLSG